MPRTLRDSGLIRLTTCLFLLTSAAALAADEYGDARAELVAAYQAQDFAAMRLAARKSLDARPGYGGALFNLALAQSLDGDPEAALRTLRVLADKKIDFGVADIDEFAAVRELPGWSDYAAQIAELQRPLGTATVAYTYDVPDFVPEGIAAGPDGELYLGSIRNGDIVRLGPVPRRIAGFDDGRHWSVFGMRLATGGRLWFVSSALPEFAELVLDEVGSTGLFELDVTTGEFLRRRLLPQREGQQVLGDLVLVDDDTIYLADQAGGVLYEYSKSGDAFSTLVEAGHLRSPQGLVLDAAQANLYVADYTGGLYRVQLDDRSVHKVPVPASISDYGIDGLYRYADRLIAIQNGVRPHRVIEMQLAPDGKAVVAGRILAMNLPEFDEPNLGVVRGDEFLFIANSHWNRFDAERNLPDGLSGPIVMSIDLRE